MQRLVRNGFIVSIKGKGGGFYFEENKPELPLIKLVIGIEGGEFLNRCGFGLKSCNADHPCPLHDEYASIRKSIHKLLSTETIQSLAGKYAFHSYRLM